PHIGAARLELGDPLLDFVLANASVATPRPVLKWAERTAWAVAVIALGIAFALTAHFSNEAPKSSGLVRFQITPATGETFPGAGGAPRFSLSPDGRYLVYASVGSHSDEFRVRRLDSVESTTLHGSEVPNANAEATQSPLWSPDSRTVAFFDGLSGKL